MKKKFPTTLLRFEVISVLAVAALLTGVQGTRSQEARGIRISENTSVSPFVEGSATYDSNVPLNPEDSEIDDYYMDLVGGLSFLWAPEAATLNVRGWYQWRRYMDFTELNKETWQENAEFVSGRRDRLQLKLTQRHGELADYEFTQSDVSAQAERQESGQRLIETRTRRTERSLDDFGASILREGRMITGFLGAYYASVSFDESEFDLRDWNEIYASPRLQVKISDKTTFSVSGDVGQQDSENELNEVSYVKGRIGLELTPSDKTNMRIEGGIQDHDVGGEESQDLDRTEFHFDVNTTWAMTRKTSLQLFGRNELLPTSAFTKNTKRVDQGSVGLVHNISHRLFGTAGVSYRRDDYTAPVGSVEDPLEELLGFQLRLVTRNRDRNLRIYGKGRYEIFTSNIQDEYTQLRLTAGASIAF
jgi:hypothetical protein